MANEITLALTFTVSHGGFDYQFRENAKYTQTTIGGTGGIFAATTSVLALPVGSVATLGYLVVKNLDATNYVQIGTTVSAAFTPVLRVQAGETACLRLEPGITLQTKAHTATVNLEYYLLNT